MGKILKVLTTVNKRNLEYFGHDMRHTQKYELTQLFMHGMVAARRRPGKFENGYAIGLERAPVDYLEEGSPDCSSL